MIIGQIMIGSGCYTVLIVGYVIISELSEDKFKQYSITILNLVWYFFYKVGLWLRY